MENKKINSMIREHFSRLPEKLQDAITNVDVISKLRAITQENRLHLDQGQLLENETYMVMLGLDSADNLTNNIKKELEITQELAQRIARQVGDDIFLSIRKLLKESTKKDAVKEQSEEEQGTPTVPTERKQETQESGKLSGMKRYSNQHIDLNQDKKGYTVDPYREPID